MIQRSEACPATVEKLRSLQTSCPGTKHVDHNDSPSPVMGVWRVIMHHLILDFHIGRKIKVGACRLGLERRSTSRSSCKSSLRPGPVERSDEE